MKVYSFPMKKWLYSDHILLGVVLIFCFVYRFYCHWFLFPDLILYNSDSVTYFAPINVHEGIVNAYRTPIYIYVIMLFKYMSNYNYIKNIIQFQHVISFLSIIPFYYIVKRVTNSLYLVALSSFSYGLFNGFIIQSHYINPESLCVAGSTFILYLFVNYVYNPSKYTLLMIGILSFILIMLKPVYIILIGIYPVFLMFRYFMFMEERMILSWGLFGWLFAVAGVLGYCEINKDGDILILSKVGLNNSLSNIITSGAYKEGKDIELINLIDSTKHEGVYTSVFLLNNDSVDNFKLSYKYFPTNIRPSHDIKLCLAIPDTTNYSYARLNKFVSNSQHTILYLNYLMKRIVNMCTKYALLLLIIISEAIAVIYGYVKYNNIAWIQSISVLFVVANIAIITIVVGQFSLDINSPIDAVYRLLAPSYPFLILLVTSLVRNLIFFLSRSDQRIGWG